MQKITTEEILKIFPELNERLGRIYQRSEEYRKSIEQENALEEKLRKALSKEQMKLVDDYLDVIGATSGIAELLAYRQGIRDLTYMLTGED